MKVTQFTNLSTSAAALSSPEYDRALRFVLEAEGGINSSPHDSGNRGGNVTNYGVTQTVYNDWRREKGLSVRSTRAITLQEVKELYYEDFWLASGSDLLPTPLNIVHFDAAIHSGPRQAILFLQKAVGARQDGVIGNETRRKYLQVDKSKLLQRYIGLRQKFYEGIAANNQNKIFLKGWLNRLSKLQKFIAR